MNEQLKAKLASMISLAESYLSNPSSAKAIRLCNEIKLLKPLIKEDTNTQSEMFKSQR
jgi:hypothetical protein